MPQRPFFTRSPVSRGAQAAPRAVHDEDVGGRHVVDENERDIGRAAAVRGDGFVEGETGARPSAESAAAGRAGRRSDTLEGYAAIQSTRK